MSLDIPETNSYLQSDRIVSSWEVAAERFYTLTFTNTDNKQSSLPQQQSRSVAVPIALSSKSSSQNSPTTGPSGPPSSHSATAPAAVTTASIANLSRTPFPPLGSPSSSVSSNVPSILQKAILLKDALLDSSDIPIVAMWADKSLTIPNKAARKYFHHVTDAEVKGGSGAVPTWKIWDETFSRQLDPDEYPLNYLVKTQKPYPSRLIGLHDLETGLRKVFDCEFHHENGDLHKLCSACGI